MLCTYRGGRGFFLFRSHRPRNALYLVTFIIPQFPQTFHSVIFLYPSFNKQQYQSFSTLALSPKSKKLHMVCGQKIATFFTLISDAGHRLPSYALF